MVKRAAKPTGRTVLAHPAFGRPSDFTCHAFTGLIKWRHCTVSARLQRDEEALAQWPRAINGEVELHSRASAVKHLEHRNKTVAGAVRASDMRSSSSDAVHVKTDASRPLGYLGALPESRAPALRRSGHAAPAAATGDNDLRSQRTSCSARAMKRCQQKLQFHGSGSSK